MGGGGGGGGAFLAQYPVEFECADCVLHVSIRTMETRLSIKSPFFGHSVLNSFSTTLKEGRSAESSAQQQPMSCKVWGGGGGYRPLLSQYVLSSVDVTEC